MPPPLPDPAQPAVGCGVQHGRRPCRYGAAGLRVPPSLAALLLLAAVTPARAWDHVGHMLVAEIAAERLSPEVRRAVDADLAVFNTRFQTYYDPVNAACWMDDVRSQTKQYDTWHYIDIELQHPAPPLGRPTPNALWLANGCLEILAGRGALGPAHDGLPIDRPAALVFLLHMVGDLHQPLHCSDHMDRGGNNVGVPNLSEVAGRARHLHHFWDSAYRRSFENGTVTELYVPPYRSHTEWAAMHALNLPWVKVRAALLTQSFAPEKGWSAATPETWVKEGFATAEKVVYGTLSGGVETKLAPLTEAYVRQAQEVSRRKITLAGCRLAEILKVGISGEIDVASPTSQSQGG